MKTLIITVLILVMFLPFVPYKGTYIANASEPTPREYVKLFANRYNVSEQLMIAIINCENPQWIPSLQSYYVKKGIRENSWGLVQIHLPSHPHIKKEQAIDPEFAINFLAKNLSFGKGKMWSCYGKASRSLVIR